jgi:hypothetical protein
LNVPSIKWLSPQPIVAGNEITPPKTGNLTEFFSFDRRENEASGRAHSSYETFFCRRTSRP